MITPILTASASASTPRPLRVLPADMRASPSSCTTIDAAAWALPQLARRLPFNVLANGDRLTLLHWTAAQIADPTYDLAITALLVGHPPLSAPPVLQATRILTELDGWQSEDAVDHRNGHPWYALAPAMGRLVDSFLAT